MYIILLLEFLLFNMNVQNEEIIAQTAKGKVPI